MTSTNFHVAQKIMKIKQSKQNQRIIIKNAAAMAVAYNQEARRSNLLNRTGVPKLFRDRAISEY